MRAARRLWAHLMKEKMGAKSPKIDAPTMSFSDIGVVTNCTGWWRILLCTYASSKNSIFVNELAVTIRRFSMS